MVWSIRTEIILQTEREIPAQMCRDFRLSKNLPLTKGSDFINEVWFCVAKLGGRDLRLPLSHFVTAPLTRGAKCGDFFDKLESSHLSVRAFVK